MSDTPRILFIADAGPEVGGGHVMRCLTLARALMARGARCAFAATEGAVAVLDTYGADMQRARPDAAIAEGFDAVVFDHYGLTAEQHRATAMGLPVLVIDDLADRPLGADIVLDSGPGRVAEDYAALVSDSTRLLLGPMYAPVRPEFAALREAALTRRGEVGVGRILISLGLTDLGGMTGRVLDRLRPRIGDMGLDVVIGAEAPSRAGLERVARHDVRVTIHVDTPDMALLIANADLAVGAAGSTTWERCTLGLPSILLTLAPNQREAARTMADLGAALTVDAEGPGFEAAFDRACVVILRDRALRAEMSAKCAAICDGQGAERTADAFMERACARLI